MMVYNSWVYACIRIIAEESANPRWRLFKMDGDEATKIFDHEVLDLLHGVSEMQTGYELKYLIGSPLRRAKNYQGGRSQLGRYKHSRSLESRKFSILHHGVGNDLKERWNQFQNTYSNPKHDKSS